MLINYLMLIVLVNQTDTAIINRPGQLQVPLAADLSVA